MTLVGPIRPLPRKDVLDRSQATLPACWERAGPVAAFPERLGPLYRASPGFPEKLAMSRGTSFLAIALPAADYRPLLQAALDAAAKGFRVYLLGAAGFGGSVEEHGLLKSCSQRLLARRGVDLPYSLAIFGRGLGGLARSENGWTLPLSQTQAAAAFGVFMHLFWHHAPEELGAGPDGLRFRTSPGAPEEAARPGDRAQVGFGHLDPREASRHLVLPDGLDGRRSEAPRTWVPARPGAASLLASMTRGRVTWTEAGLPAVALSQDKGSLGFGAGSRWPLLIRLDSEQSAGLSEALDGAPIEWELQRDKALAELRGEILFGGATQPERVASSVPLPARDVQAERLEDMESAAPSEFPTPPPLAREVIYTWTVRPPLAPPKAERARLVREWEALDEKTRAQVAEHTALVAELRARGEDFRERFTRIAGEMLGFRMSLDELAIRLSRAAASFPSERGLEGAGQQLTELADLGDELARIAKEQGVTAQKAKDDEERERQEAEHRRKQQIARERAAELAAKIEEGEKRLSTIGAELDAAAKVDPSPDQQALKKKLWDEKKKLEKELRSLSQDKGTEEQARDKPFQFERAQSKPDTAKRRPAFIPAEASRATLAVPREALPKHGALLEHQGRRYLVVKTWEEFAAAEEDAARLNAPRVAKGEEA